MHRRTCGRVPRGDDVFASQCVEGRVLRVARTKTLRASSRGRDARNPDTSNSQTEQRNLRKSTNPCSTSTRRNARWAQACRASYAQRTHCRAFAPAFSQNDRLQARASNRAEPSETAVCDQLHPGSRSGVGLGYQCATAAPKGTGNELTFDCVRSCMGDGGGPSGIGLQGRVSTASSGIG